MKVLCIDIGATRIKWSVLHDKPSLSELEVAAIGGMRSLGWFNAHLRDILNGTVWGSIMEADRQLSDFDRLAVSICCGVDPDTEKLCGYHVDHHGLPSDLKVKFERLIGGRPVRLINDAEAWLRGAVAIAGLKNIGVQWPAVGLSFGTGVGIAIAYGPGKVEPREFAGPFLPTQLSRAAGLSETAKGWEVNEILSKRFFEWVEQVQYHWSYIEIREAFTDRVLGLLNDLASQIVAPVTLFIGGGNAELVSVRQIQDAAGISVIPMSKATLGRMNPDIVPLLGLLEK